MKGPRRRVSYAQSLKAFKALEQRIIKGYPDVALARKRTALVSTLLKLADQLAAGLSVLASMQIPADRTNTPDFLKADRPIADLRAFRVELLDMFCKGIDGAAKDPEVAELRARLAKEPGPGGEIIDAGRLLAWLLQWHLFIQLQVEASCTADLPSHDIDTHIEEAARDEISMARKNMTLANMRRAINEDDQRRDRHGVGGRTKAIERRRKDIDKLMTVFWPAFQEAIDQEMRVLAAGCAEGSQDAWDLRALRERLNNRKDPRTRALFKKWLKVILHLETADPETVTLDPDGTVPGPVDSPRPK